MIFLAKAVACYYVDTHIFKSKENKCCTISYSFSRIYFTRYDVLTYQIITMKCWRTAFSFHWKLSVGISIIYCKETEYYWLICDRLITGCFGGGRLCDWYYYKSWISCWNNSQTEITNKMWQFAALKFS